mgnify:FL=1
MKKAVLIYIGILAGVFVLFSLLGRDSDYAIEQMAWKVQREYIDILKDPKVVPEQTFNKVIRDYQKIIERYPSSKLTPMIRMLVGNVYHVKKDYETSREKFNEIIELYPQNRELQAQALSAIGRTYEAQDNWPGARKIYDRIVADYALTRTGLGIPLYIANHYKGVNDYQKTMDAYERAITHYNALAAQNPDSPAEYNSLRYLSNCYLDQKRWREAVEALGKITAKYGRPERMNIRTLDIILKTINTVSVYQLKDYELPLQIYQDIITKDPNHPWKDYFQKMIDTLSTLKAKSVQVPAVQ